VTATAAPLGELEPHRARQRERARHPLRRPERPVVPVREVHNQWQIDGHPSPDPVLLVEEM
jgi:hypothetical protein